MRYCVLFTVSVCLVLCGCQDDLVSSAGCNGQRGENSFSYTKNLDLLYNEDFSLSYQQDLKLFYSKLNSLADEKEQSADIDKLTGHQLCRAIEQLQQNQQNLITLRN